MLTLFYFHGMDIATAAASLGVPQGTVTARLSRCVANVLVCESPL